MAIFTGFKPQGMQKIANRLGYAGDMVNFDNYLEQNPDKKRQMIAFEEAARRMEDAPYEEQDFKGAFMKLIKDRTGMGISGLYEEEMNDRKNGL